MYFKFIFSVKQFGGVCFLFFCLLTSVSHSTDTSEGVHKLPIEPNNNILTPPIPVQEEKQDENGNTEPPQSHDASAVAPDSSEESPSEPPPANLDVSSSETEQQPSELQEAQVRKDEEDLLQLPTMDEFITQNILKPDSTAQGTNGAAIPEPLTPISPADSPQTPGSPPTNGKESKSNGQHQTPPKQKNYASADCGAKIVATNPECRNAGGILNENRDDYMLNKCSLEAMWVTVELCDYIQVQSIELSVHELFSSLPENFTISLNDRRGVTPETWQPPTLFTAKNVRGVQTFRVPLAEQYHARFVRLSFLSHYGSEHYCPLTTLRVSGANVMEVLEAMESRSASQEDEPLSIVPSLSLDANDSGREEVGEVGRGKGSSNGIISSALDGIYKLVWPEEHTVPIDLSIEVKNDTAANEGINDTVSEDSKEPIKVGLKQDGETESGSVELSNDTDGLQGHLNDSKPSYPEVSSHEHAPSTDGRNMSTNWNGGQNQSESMQEELTSPSERDVSSDLKTDTPEDASRKLDLAHQNQTSETSESVGTVDAEAELQENAMQHNTGSVPTTSNTPDNTSSQETIPPSASPKDPPPPNTPPTSQNYLVRMQERIARLGENVTLIHRYLDQFRFSIQRNVNRTEEVQRNLERKLSQLETHLNLTLLHGYINGEEFECAKSLCADSNASMASHVQLIKSLFLGYFILTALTFVLIGIGLMRYFKKQMRRELNFHSTQMNLKLQRILNSLENESEREIKRSASLHPLITRTQNGVMEQHITDQGVLSDSNVHTYAYSHGVVKKKKKMRKSSNFNISHPY